MLSNCAKKNKVVMQTEHILKSTKLEMIQTAGQKMICLTNDCPTLGPSVFVRLFEPLPGALARRLLFALGTGSCRKTKPMNEF